MPSEARGGVIAKAIATTTNDVKALKWFSAVVQVNEDTP